MSVENADQGQKSEVARRNTGLRRYVLEISPGLISLNRKSIEQAGLLVAREALVFAWRSGRKRCGIDLH